MSLITRQDFERVEIKVGTIVQVEDFPEAQAGVQVVGGSGEEEGIRKSSAQITSFTVRGSVEPAGNLCV